MNVRWVAEIELSAAHAAFVVATGAKCIDEKTEQLLVHTVTEINNRLLSASLDVGVFWEQYLVELLRDAEMQQACTVALMWSGCSEMQIDQTSKAIARGLMDARLAFVQRFPKLVEQLDLRCRPLRERWDALGTGLLHEVGRLVWGQPPSDWWPSSISALMVQPIRGGDGGYDPEHDRFWMEAMLTDPDPSLPELLRMTWFITRLAIDAYIRDRSSDQSLARPWSLVSVPLVLSAARELEVIPSGELPLRRAMELWQFGDANTADTLARWWAEFQHSTQPLPAALRVLASSL